MNGTHHDSIAFIGFGEAAQAFVEGWTSAGQPRDIRAFDRKTEDPTTGDAKRADYRASGVRGADSAATAVAESTLIFSLVTADQSVAAADSVCGAAPPGAWFFDMNSVSPQTKRAAAVRVEAAGMRYVDVAVMSPVRPALLKAPLLVSGPHAEEAVHRLTTLGFTARAVAGDIGAASAIKMIRSIMVKGMEALTAECLLSAVAAGVQDEVLASLAESWPEWNWPAKADYNFDRMLVHGRRRAAEMAESAATAHDLGLFGTMARATTEWQARIGGLDLASPPGLTAKTAAILAALGLSSPGSVTTGACSS